MRKFVLAAVAFLSCLPALAQSDRVEVFGGYSLFVIDSGDQRRFGPVLPRLLGNSGSQVFDGWDAEVSFHLMPLISVVADVSGHYQNVDVIQPSRFGNLPNIVIPTTTHMYCVLAGPRLSFKAGPVRPFAHVLVGLSHTTAHDNPPDTPAPAPVRDNNFAVAFGGGIDVSIATHISVRPVKLDYMLLKIDPNELTPFVLESEPGTTSNLRYSAGIVFRF